MWVRQWRGEVARGEAEACLAFLHTIAVPRHRSAPGNLSAHVLRLAGEVTDEFRLFSYWHSLEAIQAFARAEEPAAAKDQAERNYLASIGLEVLVYQPFDLGRELINR
jgi:heme-degrading monooxygenase HmoA